MNQRDWFILGSKLVGLYCLVLAVPTFITHSSAAFVPLDYPPDMARSYQIYKFLMILTPVLLALFGFYLIRDGSIVHEFAYPETESGELDLEALFTIGMKVYGVYLVAGSLVEGLKIVSTYIFVSNAPVYMGTGQELYGLQTQLLPTIGSIILAIYFIFWGQRLTSLAVRGIQKKEGS
jgi:hypothetical protein